MGKGSGQQNRSTLSLTASVKDALPQRATLQDSSADAPCQRSTKSYVWLDQWIESSGPYLYYPVADKQTQARMLREGIKSSDYFLSPDSASDHPYRGSIWDLRPGHTYLYTPYHLKRVPHVEKSSLTHAIQVDLRKLKRVNLDPDEGVFWDRTYPSNNNKGYSLDPFGIGDPLKMVPAYDQSPQSSQYNSYGAWAESMQLGDNPAHTQHSLEQCGAVSYRDIILPQALKPSAVEWRKVITGAGWRSYTRRRNS
jgi:hypothetical protein